MEQINDLIRQRILKLDDLKRQNIDPYPRKYEVKNYSSEIIEKFADKQEFSENEISVRMAGRIMSLREHGKTCFLNIQDSTGTIQLYVRRDKIGEYRFDNIFKLLDIGDIIGAEGWLFKTRTGELTVFVQDFSLLAKSLRPLPEKWHGLKDKETRYRQRYVDLIVNPNVKKVFITRTKVIQTIRDFLNNQGFLEVETPTLQPIYGGARARPFITHHNALGINLYLRIADELYLKRLIVGGFDKVYEICKDFRNEGMDKEHNPEFTMLELYKAYSDYEDMMRITEEMIAYTAKEACGSTIINYQGKEIDLTPPWKRISMLGAIKDALGIDIENMDVQELIKIAKENDLEVPNIVSRGGMIDIIFDKFVKEDLIQPTLITDHPVEVSPLAKRKADNNGLTERFEIFVSGFELGNAFSELNDPIDQRERFIEQAKQREAGDEEAHMMDEDFLRALEYGMPPTGGLGIGIDRLVMLLTDMPSLRDVILFPQMRPEEHAIEEI